MSKAIEFVSTRISVAWAIYKGERFIEELLHSIFSQTLLPDEIVISDDFPRMVHQQSSTS